VGSVSDLHHRRILAHLDFRQRNEAPMKYDPNAETVEDLDPYRTVTHLVNGVPHCYMGHPECYDAHDSVRRADEADWEEDRQ
jgi:hypothetical protein